MTTETTSQTQPTAPRPAAPAPVHVVLDEATSDLLHHLSGPGAMLMIVPTPPGTPAPDAAPAKE